MKIYVEAIMEQEDMVCYFESVLSKRDITILNRGLVRNNNDNKLYYYYEFKAKDESSILNSK